MIWVDGRVSILFGTCSYGLGKHNDICAASPVNGHGCRVSVQLDQNDGVGHCGICLIGTGIEIVISNTEQGAPSLGGFR